MLTVVGDEVPVVVGRCAERVSVLRGVEVSVLHHSKQPRSATTLIIDSPLAIAIAAATRTSAIGDGTEPVEAMSLAPALALGGFPPPLSRPKNFFISPLFFLSSARRCSSGRCWVRMDGLMVVGGSEQLERPLQL